jgi:hypothetical protein
VVDLTTKDSPVEFSVLILLVLNPGWAVKERIGKF